MSVSTTASTQSFAGGQASLEFSFTTLPDSPTYVKLKAVLITSGAETELAYTTGYTVAVNSDGVGGTITVSPTYSTLYRYVAYRETANTQESDYEDYNNFPADTVESDFDKRTLVVQEKNEEVDRCIKVPLAGETFDAEMPYPVANRYVKINATADGLELDALTTTEVAYDGTITVGTDASKAASPEANDLHWSTDTRKIYFCSTGGTWSNSFTFADITAAAITADSFTGAGGSSVVTAKATDYTVAAGDLAGNTAFTNNGAGAEVEFTLPAGTAGDKVTFMVTDAEYLKIVTDGTETLRYLNVQSAAGGYLRSNTVGNSVTLIYNADDWLVVTMTGEWYFDE